ncbi:MAG: peptide-binding protein [Thermodesulfobacteriota bacterium]
MFLRFPPLITLLFVALSLFSFTWVEGATPAASADGAAGDLRKSYGDTIIVGSIGEPSVLIPMLAGDASSHDIAGLVINGLVKYDTDLTIIGDLAESWDVSEDGLTITFHLREGVRWSDGVEFTADDVLFGYRTIIDEKTPTAYAEDFRQISRAEVLDRYTFRVTYKKPFAPALSTWGNLTVLPKHLLEGKDITKSELGRHPVGMGPFKFVRWVPGQEVVLESNHDYFEGRPYIDRYVYRIIPDPATMFLELKTGGVDLMGLTPMQYTRQTVSPLFRKEFRKYRYPVPSYTYLGFNLKRPLFADKRVRQALAYGIDKQEIVDGVLLGLGSPATGPYVPETWPYNPNVKKYEYDKERALSLLREAGWEDNDGDGLLDKDGSPFEFTILTNMGNNSRLKTATIIQWRLKMIGIKVNIKAVEWATFINEFVDKRRFDAVILGWSIGLDPDQYDIWHSSKTKEKEFNFISFNNSEVDDLLDRGRSVFDIEERKKAYFRIQEILAEEAPYIFLYVPDATPIVHARFQGIEPAPLIGIRYNINEWYVPRGLQRHRMEE